MADLLYRLSCFEVAPDLSKRFMDMYSVVFEATRDR